ncbi:unnamed protein product [Didymodactylos carnosus]|uniref:Uncharacterized protein n=1 Tax=Didymodactylos carnosus TaxID=1234261 RepID=A0A8S2D1Y7_9BILA|nr:unnamed protein product [Didymodactylos carnosus]CAF3642704.1 unnamed protein product [Didymodactylos carnosus]
MRTDHRRNECVVDANQMCYSISAIYSLPVGSVPIVKLGNDVTEQLVKQHIITKREKLLGEIIEKDLLLSRLQQTIDIDREGLVICPTHRYNYDVEWTPQNHCYHADPKNDTKRQSTKKNYRRATLEQVNNLAGFLIGGRLCYKRRTISETADTMTLITVPSSPDSNVTFEKRINTKESANRILTKANLSPQKPNNDATSDSVRQ